MNPKHNSIATIFSTVICAVGLIQTAEAQQPSNAFTDHVSQGMEHFQAARIDESIASFQAAKKLDDTMTPRLWQLGISLYYAKEYAAGQKQFEVHKSVNPHDVENAAWHFLCVAKQKKDNGVSAARESLIKIDTSRDTRVPMSEIYEFYAGRSSEDAVLKSAKQSGQPTAMMYANLYLGLFHEVAGKPDLARKHLLLAAKEKLTNNYMQDVAKVHVKLRGWDEK